MKTAEELIEAIKVNAPNLYHIAETGKINGNLYNDLKTTIGELLQENERLKEEIKTCHQVYRTDLGKIDEQAKRIEELDYLLSESGALGKNYYEQIKKLEGLLKEIYKYVNEIKAALNL